MTARRRLSAVIVLVGLMIVACTGNGGSPSTTPAGPCTVLPGEQPTAIAWAPDGLSLAIASEVLAEGTIVVRRLDWPSRQLQELARAAEIRSRTVGAGSGGKVSWLRDIGGTIAVEEHDGTAEMRLAIVDTAAVFNLVRLADGFAAYVSPTDGDGSVLWYRGDGRIENVFSTTDVVDSFGMSPDGRVVAIHHFRDVGVPGSVTTIVDGVSTTTPVSGTGIAHLVVAASGEKLAFIDVETGALMASSLRLEGSGVLRPSSTIGDISGQGLVAWVPAPTETLEVPVCVDAG